VVDAAGIESIAITATDTVTKAINTATLNLKDAALKTVTATGNSNLTLTLDANVVALTSLDASAMTGKLTAATNGTVAQTILGGSGADTLTGAATGSGDTLNGGAGADTLVVMGDLTTLVGGAGADTFNVGDATTNVNSYASITDLAAGDKIQFSAAANTFAASKVVLAGTAVFQDYANAAINLTNAGDVSWFQFLGNTYVIENASNGVSFVNGTDFIVQVVGTVDLSTASFSSTADTLLIV
jgi:S-layer protein